MQVVHFRVIVLIVLGKEQTLEGFVNNIMTDALVSMTPYGAGIALKDIVFCQ